MRHSWIPPFFSLLALLSAVQGRAEETNSVATGDRVRVLAPRVAERSIIGTLLGTKGDDLILDAAGSPDRVVVPRAAIAKLEVSRGRRSRASGALVGGIVGAAAGGIIVAAAHKKSPLHCPSSDFGCALGAAMGESLVEVGSVVGGLFVGAVVGSLAGVAVSPREKWQIVSTERLSISLAAPGPHAAGVTISMRF